MFKESMKIVVTYMGVVQNMSFSCLHICQFYTIFLAPLCKSSSSSVIKTEIKIAAGCLGVDIRGSWTQ
jgi:hypothetical protein